MAIQFDFRSNRISDERHINRDSASRILQHNMRHKSALLNDCACRESVGQRPVAEHASELLCVHLCDDVGSLRCGQRSLTVDVRRTVVVWIVRIVVVVVVIVIVIVVVLDIIKFECLFTSVSSHSATTQSQWVSRDADSTHRPAPPPHACYS